MKKVEFISQGDKEYRVDVDGDEYGKLVFDYERNDEESTHPLWILWPNAIDDAVSYSDDLKETEEDITDEIQSYED
ncbi:hypothetical protein PQ472_07640 [Lacticaseibacillus pabuli]|uniref:Uncharacterized protein n=1 Tax=Lacticaseibacillus pabuli TaxID=3025672 RepID=A0ABY7WNU6_9LACO|nr:hypothetical protein [Lacticaseibacillus sp. KACC 23028]WDF81796.1 hypothetical protein PQ472_07640 [Lacticaseibacillus sp. KACC 23028]